MKPILFDEESRNYSSNGIGVLYDAIRCDVYEVRNGSFDAELEYPASGEWANEIKEQRQILAKPNDVDAPHAFRIYEVEKDLESGIIFARATSVTDDLAGNIVMDVAVKDVTPQAALTAIKANLIEPTIFDFVSDIETQSSSQWTRINPLQAFVGVEGSLVQRWGGEIKRTNNTVYLYSRRGRDRVTVIRPGKNIDGFNMTVSTKGLITKILPMFSYSFEGIPEYEMVTDYEGKRVKQKKYAENEPVQQEPTLVVGDVFTSEHAHKYPVNYYEPIDYSDDEGLQGKVNKFIQDRLDAAESSPTIIDDSKFPEELKTYIKGILNTEAARYFIYRNPGVDEPKVQIKVDMMQLSDSPEWERYKNLERIQVTDTVEVYVKQFDTDVTVTIDSIEYDSIGERVLKITAGSASSTLSDSISKEYEDKVKDLERYVDRVENGVYNSISRTASGQNRRFSGYTEPPESISSEGDLWFKEVGAGKIEIYVYKGGIWTPIISGEVIESMQRAVENAKEAADDADRKAQGTIEDIKSVIEGNGFTTLDDLFASKISEEEFGTLFFQNSKAIGFVYEEDGENKAIIMIDEGMPYIKGEHIILNGDTIVDGTFTVTDTMIAPEAIINHLTATGIDAQDVRIVNLDASSIVAGDLELSKGLRITYRGAPILSVENGQVKITAPNLATKEDLEAIELIPGPKGADGTSQYMHIRYSANSNGNPMTTSPQSNTSYIGLANTTSSTAPTGHASYTWSLFKGEQGGQGIPGGKGADGQTTYTWVKYADDDKGTGLVDTPDGKRYIGLAFNKTTQTESDTASDYTWSPLYDNVVVGGRNLMLNSTFNNGLKNWGVSASTAIDPEPDKPTSSILHVQWSSATAPQTPMYNTPRKWFDTDGTKQYTLSFDFYCEDLDAWDGSTIAGVRIFDAITGGNQLYAYQVSKTTMINQGLVSGKWTRIVYTFKPEKSGYMTAHAYRSGLKGNFKYREFQLERGNIPTGWSPAPEDIEEALNNKAGSEDIENLAEIISDMSAVVNAKAGMGEFEAMEEAFNTRVAQDIIDKAQLAEDLSTIEGRTTLVEIIAGDSKLVTEFIDTIITESEEGIFIGNKAMSTGVLISDKRISFIDNGTEVAYISNKTMEITHGIFVETATIADFKFEKIPGTSILTIAWVGG